MLREEIQKPKPALFGPCDLDRQVLLELTTRSAVPEQEATSSDMLAGLESAALADQQQTPAVAKKSAWNWPKCSSPGGFKIPRALLSQLL